jgi:hypothetical protein
MIEGDPGRQAVPTRIDAFRSLACLRADARVPLSPGPGRRTKSGLC